MPDANILANDRPTTDDIRAALDRIAASEEFRASPQLVAFLRYVVEAKLRGGENRIKGYTIAVEALGRGDEFDPQDDPIVRVEAKRLRRAIHRYYENGGKHDPLRIDLPVGSYVPAFRRASPSPLAARQRAPFFKLRSDWRRLATGAALILTGAAIYAVLDFWFDFNRPNPSAVQGLIAPPNCAQEAVGSGCASNAMIGSATK